MSDQYYSAIQEQWSNIRGLYMAYGSKKPIMLYDIHEKKIYAYPYKEFKAELSEKSQVSLEIDYRSTSVRGGVIVFVRDDIERKLVSYVMNIDAATIHNERAFGDRFIGGVGGPMVDPWGWPSKSA